MGMMHGLGFRAKFLGQWVEGTVLMYVMYDNMLNLEAYLDP